jgi:transcriptional regulator with XRE-family HTH domain
MAYVAQSGDPRTVGFLKSVGRQVFFARIWQGLSQRQLEYLCRVDQSTISRLERGLAPGLRLERLAAIRAVLGIADLRATSPHPDARR